MNIVKKVYNNLKIELMQWQLHMARGTSFGSKKNISWPRKRNLDNKFRRFEV